jgi:hypothetical protein
METTRFDALARQVHARLSRRGLLGRAGGLLIAGALAAPEPGAVLAARTVCRKGGRGCTRNAQCCAGLCLTSSTLPRRLRNTCSLCPATALACGSSCCGAGSSCIDNVCVSTCELEQDATTCLLTARRSVQLTGCWRVGVYDAPCIDDSDCDDVVDLTNSDTPYEDYGCVVSFTSGEGVSRDWAGNCMAWAVHPEYCLN